MSDLNLKVSAAASEPASLPASSSSALPTPSPVTGSTPTAAGSSATPPNSNEPAQQQAPGSSLPTEAAVPPWEPAPHERERREKKDRHANPLNQPGNWLRDEPRTWVDRKVRNRSNAAVYMVRQVFKNSRVQLERNWMSYMTDVDTVRAKYEPYV